MKRGARLTAIVMALQQRTETAASLAAKLEVSKRTIMRDIQALSEMGVPLYAVSGPSGGYRLMEGYKLPPLGLTEAEAQQAGAVHTRAPLPHSASDADAGGGGRGARAARAVPFAAARTVAAASARAAA